MDIVPEINEYVANVKQQLDNYITAQLASYRASLLDGLEETYTDRFGELAPDHINPCVNNYITCNLGKYFWIIHYMHYVHDHRMRYCVFDNYGNIINVCSCDNGHHISTCKPDPFPPGTITSYLNRTIPLSDKQINYIKKINNTTHIKNGHKIFEKIEDIHHSTFSYSIQPIVKDHFDLQQKCALQSKRIAELEAELSTFKRAPIGNLLDICEVELLIPKRAPICEDATKELDYVV